MVCFSLSTVVQVGFGEDSYRVTENEGMVTLQIIKQGITNETLMVMFQTEDGTATAATSQGWE